LYFEEENSKIFDGLLWNWQFLAHKDQLIESEAAITFDWFMALKEKVEGELKHPREIKSSIKEELIERQEKLISSKSQLHFVAGPFCPRIIVQNKKRA